MNVLTKLASQESSRLEKIAAAIEAINEGYNPEEVIAFAAEQGIHPDEIVLGANLFGAADLEKEAAEDELQKLASVVTDENTLPLVKVAAAVDLFAAGALEPEQVYGIGEALGFDQQDVDYIFASAYPELAKEAGAKEEAAKEGAEAANKIKEILSKGWQGTKDAYMLRGIRGAFKKEGDKLNVDWKQLGKGVAASGVAYGIPVGAGAYLYAKNKKDQEGQ